MATTNETETTCECGSRKESCECGALCACQSTWDRAYVMGVLGRHKPARLGAACGAPDRRPSC